MLLVPERRLYATADGYSPAAFAEAEEVMSEASGQALRAGEIVRRLREFVGKGAGERRVEAMDTLVDAASRLALIDAAANGIQIDRVAVRALRHELEHSSAGCCPDL